MFRNRQISRYFSRIGHSKDRLSGTTSGESNGQSVDIVSTGAIGASEGSPIAMSNISEHGGLQSGSIGSSSHPRAYPVSDPYYVHPTREIAKHVHEMVNSVCDQPHQRRRSNPAVKLITPTRLEVPLAIGVVDFVDPADNGPLVHDLTSDTNRFELCDDQVDEVDPDVLEWIKAQDKQKASYEATRRFQETWAAKLTWAECVRRMDGLYDFVRCITCMTFETREKILQPKWNTLKKHSGKRKAKHAMPTKGIRKGQW
jgi:hypothetical protein